MAASNGQEVVETTLQTKEKYIRDSVIAERIEEMGDPTRPIVNANAIRILEVGDEISVAEGSVEIEFDNCKMVPDFEYVDELVDELLKLYPAEMPEGPGNYRTQLEVFKNNVLSRLKSTDSLGVSEDPDNYDNSEVLNELEFKIKELLGKCGFGDVEVVPALYAKTFFRDKKDVPIRTEVIADSFGENINIVSNGQGFQRGVPGNLNTVEIANLETGITVVPGIEFIVKGNPSKRALATALTMQYTNKDIPEKTITIAIKKLTDYISFRNLYTLLNKFKPHEFEKKSSILSRLAKDVLKASLDGNDNWPPEPTDVIN